MFPIEAGILIPFKYACLPPQIYIYVSEPDSKFILQIYIGLLKKK